VADEGRKVTYAETIAPTKCRGGAVLHVEFSSISGQNLPSMRHWKAFVAHIVPSHLMGIGVGACDFSYQFNFNPN
jgi:hypothetical protein